MPVSDVRGFVPDATIKTTGERVVYVTDTTVWGQPGARVLHASGDYRDWHRDAVERDAA